MKYLACIVLLLLACVSAPTRPTWVPAVDTAYQAFCWMYYEGMFEETQNNSVVRWFATFSHHEFAQYVVQLNKRSFQIPCQKCYLIGNWDGCQGAECKWYCEIRAIVLTWLHGDPTDPKNWTWKKVNW